MIANDLQNANQQLLLFFCLQWYMERFFVTEENLWQSAIIFSVRRLIKPTWLNDRDQFLQPTQPFQKNLKPIV